MERPRCDFEACNLAADAFNVVLATFACSQHAMLTWSRGAGAVMSILSRVRPSVCRNNGCGRAAFYRGVRSGDFFCATHGGGLPSHMITSDLGDSGIQVLVEVSLGEKDGEYDLIPLTETANCIGRRGFRVANLTWREEGGVASPRPDHRVWLHLEPFTGGAGLDPEIQNQIALLEKQYASVRSELLALRENFRVVDDRYLREQAENQVLRGSIQDLKDQLEQANLRYQSILADSRQETIYLPELQVDMEEFR